MTSSKATTSLQPLAERFVTHFRGTPIVVQAPGRVNLIGEHTDYNDGFVMPAAIQFQTTVAIAARPDQRLLISSENYGEQVEFSLPDLPPAAKKHWSDYVVGVVRQLTERGIRLPGANLMIQGDVPQGAGLSSSASLEVAVCRALLELTGDTLPPAEVALLCQRAENEFVGARCGIMDQFISVHGHKDHALLLDCRSLEFSQQPLPQNVRLVICNTMVRHRLAGGEYNLRRQECEAGARFFAEKRPEVKALRDVSLEEFEAFASALPAPIQKRCRHVISENRRVTDAAEALQRRDLSTLGRLMAESHKSLRDDFEVSCTELDVMVDLANAVDGVYGARMTGGGFGGCTVNLVKSEHVEDFRAAIGDGYQRSTGRRPEIYVCAASNGVRRVQ